MKSRFVDILKNKSDYCYILPAVAFVTIFFITSIVYTVHLSFFRWDGFTEKIFIGFENYLMLFQDPNFLISIMNTLIWVVVSLIISLIFPLILSILIVNSANSTLFKNIFYFPSTLSATVGGLIMVAMLSKYGIPQLFGLLGFKELVRDWLAVPYVNTFLMILMGTWQGIGMNMILFIVGLRNIENSQIESAKIDGAKTFTLYFKIIFPELKPTTIVVLLMSLVNSFKVFDIIWIMTKGGPYRSSETLALTMYTEAFVRNNYGMGSAVSVLLSVVILTVAYFNLKNTFKSEKK